jgi:hypothetical protein
MPEDPTRNRADPRRSELAARVQEGSNCADLVCSACDLHGLAPPVPDRPADPAPAPAPPGAPAPAGRRAV